MKASTKNAIPDVPHPKDNPDFVGHRAATDMLTAVLNSGRIPQSWLFTGPKGIGKATLAYRFARSILAYADAPALFEKTLQVAASHPTFARISLGSHSDMLAIEPDLSTAAADIKVDQIRKITSFLRLTASETPHRIVIIDSADDMNTNAANALLKLLEEPPANAMFLLVSHAPGSLLPTIRSRCRMVRMGSLSEFDAGMVLQTALPGVPSHEAEKVIGLAGGSAGYAIELYYNRGIEIYDALLEALGILPRIDPKHVQKLGNLVITKGDSRLWDVLAYLLDTLLMRLIKSVATGVPSAGALRPEAAIAEKLARSYSVEALSELHAQTVRLLQDTSRIHLDKRAVLISLFEGIGSGS